VTEKKYRDMIGEACKSLGVYRLEFSRTRCRLAQIYVRIEELEKARQAGEFTTTTVSVTRNGETEVIDPHIQELDRLNDQALSYEKALGLTADSVRKIREDVFSPPREEDPLTHALSGLMVING